MANKFAVVIKSNGTSSGTSLVVNGADVTKEMNVTFVSFTAWSDGTIDASWSAIEKDDKGVEKRTSYSYRTPSNDGPVLEKRSTNTYIGQDSLIQFDNEQDEKTFKISGHIKKLADSIEIKEITNESPKI